MELLSIGQFTLSYFASLAFRARDQLDTKPRRRWDSNPQSMDVDEDSD